jgi:hypothetical protein
MDATAIAAWGSLAGVILVGFVLPIIRTAQDSRTRAAELRAANERADILADRVEGVRKQAVVAADILKRNTEAQVTIAAGVNGKLDTIHGLVNSTLTAAMQAALGAKLGARVFLQRLVDAERAAGKTPEKEDIDALATLDTEIADMRTVIDDRNKAAASAEKQQRNE